MHKFSGFDRIYAFNDASSALHFRSASWHLPDWFLPAFSFALSTMAFDHSTQRWFETYT
jgi:hypothetical protein